MLAIINIISSDLGRLLGRHRKIINVFVKSSKYSNHHWNRMDKEILKTKLLYMYIVPVPSRLLKKTSMFFQNLYSSKILERMIFYLTAVANQ